MTATLKAGDIYNFPTTAHDWSLYNERGRNIIARNLAQRLLADLKFFKKTYGSPTGLTSDFLAEKIKPYLNNTLHLMFKYRKYGASDTEPHDAMAYGVQTWLMHEGVSEWAAQTVARHVRY